MPISLPPFICVPCVGESYEYGKNIWWSGEKEGGSRGIAQRGDEGGEKVGYR